jgi:hypothetical protein
VSTAFAGWLHHRVYVMVHGARSASIGLTLNVRETDERPRGHVAGSQNITSPEDLRAFALKCLAAAEVMEGLEP